jgi:hypothetical protein
MTKEVIHLRANLQDPRWRVLFHDIFGDLTNQGLPIWWWDNGLVVDSFTGFGLA